jgi:hypothetical protein
MSNLTEKVKTEIPVQSFQQAPGAERQTAGHAFVGALISDLRSGNVVMA